ncbi:hypothetical protein BpHYR1_008636 [Brachionus plicatilis]|uniref:Uncharacterized protein n=1 Tax=Brachionus plicatilis TaxID=10195 RepID=A0A3M7RZ69_BRAPC|nr:hypothetical protein BpHYR1_008636 [Brachionus plicatilis]
MSICTGKKIDLIFKSIKNSFHKHIKPSEEPSKVFRFVLVYCRFSELQHPHYCVTMKPKFLTQNRKSSFGCICFHMAFLLENTVSDTTKKFSHLIHGQNHLIFSP